MLEQKAGLFKNKLDFLQRAAPYSKILEIEEIQGNEVRKFSKFRKMNSGSSGRKFLQIQESPIRAEVAQLYIAALVFLLKIPISASPHGNLRANSLWIK